VDRAAAITERRGMMNVFFPYIKSFSLMLRRSSIGFHTYNKGFLIIKHFIRPQSILESCSLHTNQLAVSSSPALHESINLGGRLNLVVILSGRASGPSLALDV
jgi:hypothetical protein